jgi:imidazolonepropionase-like amidohydrolase
MKFLSMNRFSIGFLLIGLIFIASQSFAQLPVPSNGVEESEPTSYVLRNATIIVDAETTLQNASLVITDGSISAVGKLVRFPKGSVIIDMSDKVIVPSFIETYTSVGLPDAKKAEWNPRPQLESKKAGPYYWNESIKAEVRGSDHFESDKEASKLLQQMGFVNAVSHVQDGIMRGTGPIVSLGDIDSRKAVVKTEGAAFLSFDKGTSRQTYPSSQMGAIALIRQAMYDAQYYEENKATLPKNVSLEAINHQLDLPLIFNVEDKLELFRARKIADEFGLNFTILGSGNEYERINELALLTDQKLIIPIDFPKAFDVGDPYVARQISLGELKEWELAPANPFFLAKKGISFAISSKGHKKAEDFWKHLHRAMEAGLSREDAIKALTSVPAEILQVSNQLGDLSEGKLANFSVFDKDPFEFKNAELYESWSVGKKHVIKEEMLIDIRGKYRFSFDNTSYLIDVKGDRNKPKGTVTTLKSTSDSGEPKTVQQDATISIDRKHATFHFEVDDDHYDGVITLSGLYNQQINAFIGQGSLPNGKWIEWTGIQLERFKEEVDEKNKITVDTISMQKIWYPNIAYGFDSLPKSKKYVLKNATLWTNEDRGIVSEGTIVLNEGKIEYLAQRDYNKISSAEVIDCSGLHITSGIVDEHSHIAISKGVNESGQAVSAEVSIGDVVRSDDINIYRQLAGGVTTAHLLHGSANPIGGQSALIKLKWGSSPAEMLIDNAPKFIKFALGENVKQSNWGDYQRIRFPQSRMGVEQVFYDAFLRAKAYQAKWNNYTDLSDRQRELQGVKKPARDLELETVYEVLNSERFISCHSYVQSEINMLMHVADSMGFTVNTFTHILEGYKVADKMVEHGAGGSTFSDWWAYKYEVRDAIPYNAALMHDQGVLTAINSDDAEMGRRLNQEAAKAVKYGGMSEEEAWKLVTLNPAKLLHLDDKIGSLKEGKDADVVVWTDNPLSINAKAKMVFVDGQLLYNADDMSIQQNRIAQEKARIISAMLESNKKGESKKTFVKKEKGHWHCDTIGQSAKHR